MNHQTQLEPRWSAATFVSACATGSIFAVVILYVLDYSIKIRHANELLVVLILPIFYAAFHYPRWVYLFCTWVIESVVLIFVCSIDDDPYGSLITITALLLMSLAACEIIFVSSQKRRDLEQALLECEDLYYRAIDALGGSPYYWNLRLDEYQIIGDGFRRMTGYDVGSITRKWFFEITPKIIPTGDLENLTFDRAILKFSTEHGVRWQALYEIVCRDGTRRWIADAAVQVSDKSGKNIIGAFGAFLDITRYQHTESQSGVPESFAILSDNCDSLNVNLPDLSPL